MRRTLPVKVTGTCVLFAVMGTILVSPVQLHAQGSQGNDAVYNSTATIVGSAGGGVAHSSRSLA